MILLAVLLAVLLAPMSVRADVIYEPFDDFYEEHRKECTYVGRSYTTNGPNGTVTFYGSPTDPRVEKTYSNGISLYVSYTYQTADGILWGCCDNWDDNVTGWAPMEYLELIYDEQSFSEQFGYRFEPIEGTLEDQGLAGQNIRFWVYPGSKDYMEVTAQEGMSIGYQTAFTDDDGNQWVRCGYFRGIKGHWICLSDPTADYEVLFPDAVEENTPETTEEVTTGIIEEIKPAGSNLILTVTIAVAAVVIVTAALLIVLKKKNT